MSVRRSSSARPIADSRDLYVSEKSLVSPRDTVTAHVPPGAWAISQSAVEDVANCGESSRSTHNRVDLSNEEGVVVTGRSLTKYSQPKVIRQPDFP